MRKTDPCQIEWNVIQTHSESRTKRNTVTMMHTDAPGKLRLPESGWRARAVRRAMPDFVRACPPSHRSRLSKFGRTLT